MFDQIYESVLSKHPYFVFDMCVGVVVMYSYSQVCLTVAIWLSFIIMADSHIACRSASFQLPLACQ